LAHLKKEKYQGAGKEKGKYVIIKKGAGKIKIGK
jgi:hypothetical protein